MVPTIILAAIVFLAQTKQAIGNNKGQLRGLNLLSSDYAEVECTAILAQFAVDPNAPDAGIEEESYWACRDDDNMVYRLPDSVSLNKADGQIVSGKTRIIASQAVLTKGNEEQQPSLILSPTGSIAFENRENGRALVSKSGTKSLLVVRCSTRDGSPSRSASDMSDDLFGVFGDRHNLASQMDACSGGALKFVPAAGHSSIDNGVLDIRISERSSGVSSDTVQNFCMNELQDTVGSSAQWDHIYMVLPNNVDFGGAAAFAYINYGVSVYKDANGSYLTVMMHEVGHNLGMFHSGETETYDDHSCMMGNPEFADDRPLMCFNGQKSWFLGWYSDRHESVSPGSASWSGSFVGVDDYVSGRSTLRQESVVVRVQGSTSLYVMYNKAQGVNAEVQEYGNQITVVRGSIDSNVAYESTILRGLRSGDSFRYDNFAGSNRDLVIRVCSLGAVADVVMYIDGVNNIGCNGESDPSFEEGSGGGGSCFPGEAEVEVKDRGLVQMENLSIGDMVKVADGSFEPIYSFCKKDRDAMVEYLLIYHADSDKPLALTSNHMVFVNKGFGARAMEGANVRIGNSLVLENGVLSTVVGIEHERKRGFYAPLTFSGTIVVDHVTASTFATTATGPLSVDSPWLQGIYWLSQSHHRLLCRVSWNICTEERYSDIGMSRIVEWSFIQYERFNRLPTGAQLFIGLPALLALFLAVLAEKYALWSMVGAVFCLAGYLKRRNATKG